MRKKSRNNDVVELERESVEDSTEPGSLTSGGGTVADYREQEVQQMDRLKRAVEDVSRKHNGGSDGGEDASLALVEPDPGMLSRLTRGWTTDGKRDPRSRSSE